MFQNHVFGSNIIQDSSEIVNKAGDKHLVNLQSVPSTSEQYSTESC